MGLETWEVIADVAIDLHRGYEQPNFRFCYHPNVVFDNFCIQVNGILPLRWIARLASAFFIIENLEVFGNLYLLGIFFPIKSVFDFLFALSKYNLKIGLGRLV